MTQQLIDAARRVAALNENAGEIGDGMLRTIVAEAREALAPVARSNRPEVRNPLLALPGIREAIATLPEGTRGPLRAILLALRAWRTNKAPLAFYWKVVSVYAGHIARVLR